MMTARSDNISRPILGISLIIASVLALLLPSLAFAKRAAPAEVEPVIYSGVRYVAPNDDGRRGYIEAWDVQSNKKLWELTIFTNRIDPKLEEDVQGVFIKTLEIRDGALRVRSESGKTYWVDFRTKAVKQPQQPIIYIVLFLMLVAIPVLIILDGRNVKKGHAYTVAKKLFDLQVKLFEVERCEYREVPLANFPDVELGFYETTTRELEAEGFHLLGDIANTSFAEATNLQSLMRVMVDPTRSSVAYFADVYSPRSKRHHTLINLTTEFSDDCSLETTNAKDRGYFRSPHVNVHRVSEIVSAKELFAIHRTRLEEYRSQNPGVEPKTFNSIQDVTQGWSRSRVLNVAYRKTLSTDQLRQEIERVMTLKKRDPLLMAAVGKEYEKLYKRHRAMN